MKLIHRKMSLMKFQMKFKDEQTCRDWLAEKRWGGDDKAICPHCKATKISIHSNDVLFTCQSCAKQFTVRTNTIFEGSKVTLKRWFMVIYLANSNKKGVNSLAVSRQVGVTQKTAWFMLQKIGDILEEKNAK